MSGAKNCPETPRQKMIGMMYLVLTAMLALNVSADIINGFAKLRHSMEQSMSATFNRTEDVMKRFEIECNKDEAGMAKYGQWYEVAKSIHSKSDELYYYIEDFKLNIANGVDKPKEPYQRDKMPESLKNGSDTNFPHAYAFNQLDPQTGRTNAAELKERMREYVLYMKTPLSPCFIERMSRPQFKQEFDQKVEMISALFNTDDVKNEEMQMVGWENSVFHEMPAAAVTAMLTKYQNDIRTVEFDMINFMFAQTSASAVAVNSVEAIVIPTNGEYIMQGQQYRAKIVSAMMDTNQVPQVFINGQEISGGVFTATATTPGEHTYRGYMLVGDDTTHYDFVGKYTVGTPSATISNIDLDIMYRDYENKFAISVPGVSNDQVRVSVNGGTLKRNGAQWVVLVNKDAKQVSMTVSAEMDGRVQTMGTQVFRVKNKPNAQGSMKIGEREYADGEGVPASRWTTNAQIIASYGQDGILNVPFEVTSYAMYINGAPYYSKSAALTAEMVNAINKARVGVVITISEIKAKDKITGGPTKVNTFTLKKDY